LGLSDTQVSGAEDALGCRLSAMISVWGGAFLFPPRWGRLEMPSWSRTTASTRLFLRGALGLSGPTIYLMILGTESCGPVAFESARTTAGSFPTQLCKQNPVLIG